MIDLSAMCPEHRLEYLTDMAIRHSIDEILYCLDDMPLETKLHIVSDLLSILQDYIG